MGALEDDRSYYRTLYNAYMNTDFGFLRLPDGRYDLVNGHISDHLCEIGAYISTYGESVEFRLRYRKLVQEYRSKLLKRYPDEASIWVSLTDIYMENLEIKSTEQLLKEALT